MNIQLILLIVLVVVLFIIWWWNRRGDDQPEADPYHASPFAGKAADTAPARDSHGAPAAPAPSEADDEPLPILIPLEKVELPEPAVVAPAPAATPAPPETPNPKPETQNVPLATVTAPPPVESVPVVEPVPPVEAPAPPPMAAGAAPPPAADDLEVIEGIGPKIAGVLKGAGITTFAQLAALKPDAIKQIITDGGVKTGDPTTWPQQAKLAAEGKWDKLKTLQDKLQGGRKS